MTGGDGEPLSAAPPSAELEMKVEASRAQHSAARAAAGRSGGFLPGRRPQGESERCTLNLYTPRGAYAKAGRRQVWSEIRFGRASDGRRIGLGVDGFHTRAPPTA
ncbi:hypothetical protein YTPLAS18_29160 [Nitrospira sp.]|nr:hypothetical protein YTPLAS18_29160 [Nitrospira sp.]